LLDYLAIEKDPTPAGHRVRSGRPMLTVTMLAALLALAGALVYGAADFLGGLSSRRLRSVAVTATAAATGLLLLVPAFAFTGAVWRAEDLLWGALSGVTGAAAIGLLYACLAIGPMSILSPLTAVVSAIAPMLWGLLVEGEQLSPSGYAGLALALVAIVLVAFLPGERVVRPSLRGILMAIGSGVGIGAFLIIIDQTHDDSGVLPLIANRGVTAIIMATIAVVLASTAVRRGIPRSAAPASPEPTDLHVAATPTGYVDVEHPTSVDAPHTRAAQLLSRISAGRAWALAMACGLVDATANVILLVALRAGGDLAVVSALTALYPAGTVLLAAVVLREHIARVQWLGLSLALVAGALLAIG